MHCVYDSCIILVYVCVFMSIFLNMHSLHNDDAGIGYFTKIVVEPMHRTLSLIVRLQNEMLNICAPSLL